MGLFDRIFKRLEKAKSDAQLKAIDKEIEDKKLKLQQLKDNPEWKKMKKKYNLKDIPTRSGEEVDLDDFFKNTQKQIKNFRSKTGRIKSKKEIDKKIAKGKLCLGMTDEELILMKGKPEKKTESVSRNNTKEEFYYDGYKNRQGNILQT